MTNRALADGEALRLLGSVTLGRISFTHDALPAILPVNHIVDEGSVIVRGHRGMDAVLQEAAGKVVAYSADVIDPATYVGWSVTLTGQAEIVDDPEEIARYPQIVRPWRAHEERFVVRIEPVVVTGFELLEPGEQTTGAR
jgi:nitroimidazol reductase NimA-like FMN-containing flavoprotein (pyridoxamine 5'-phosphate oxidase superfamily)